MLIHISVKARNTVTETEGGKDRERERGGER